VGHSSGQSGGAPERGAWAPRAEGGQAPLGAFGRVRRVRRVRARPLRPHGGPEGPQAGAVPLLPLHAEGRGEGEVGMPEPKPPRRGPRGAGAQLCPAPNRGPQHFARGGRTAGEVRAGVQAVAARRKGGDERPGAPRQARGRGGQLPRPAGRGAHHDGEAPREARWGARRA
jgi:hypothetical protein